MNRYEALQHAVKAHGLTPDKGGLLYTLHPMEVADRIEKNWRDIRGINAVGILPGGVSVESAVIVALLHDVLEDTDYEIDASWLSEAQWNALYLVTHQPEDTYFEYIAKICADKLATLVKLADLSHNLSPARQEALPEDQQRGLGKRYLKSRRILWDALGQDWWPI